MTPAGGARAPAPQVEATARAALSALGLAPMGPLLSLPTPILRPSRQVVYARVSGSQPPTHVVVRIACAPDAAAAQALAWEQLAARVLAEVAGRMLATGAIQQNPVAGPIHDQPLEICGDLATVWDYIPASGAKLTAAGWGQAIGRLHLLGADPQARALLTGRPPSEIPPGLEPQALLTELRQPAHPLHGRPELVQQWAQTVHAQVAHARHLDPDPLLIHRDLHPLNCIPTQGGAVVAIDWQEAGRGSRSDDFAWIYLLVRRFGGAWRTLDEALQAYAEVTGFCPTKAQITAAGHVRELIFLGYSLKNAHRSAAHLAECLTELPVLSGPKARTGRWQLLFNPEALAPELVA